MLRTLALASILSLLAAAPAHAQSAGEDAEATLYFGTWTADITFDTTSAFAETLPDDMYQICAEGEIALPEDVTATRIWDSRSEVWYILKAAATRENEVLAVWSEDGWGTFDATGVLVPLLPYVEQKNLFAEVEVTPLEVIDGALFVEVCGL